MISHVHIGVTDFERAFAFYSEVMDALGIPLKFCEHESQSGNAWAGWMPAAAARPLFLVGRAFNGEPATAGNGQMVALLAPDRVAVDACHRRALIAGGRDDGPPGLRPHYHPNYYGAYFRDPDGNKICVCCHDPA
ncbi:MAG: VOC family protein [Reyranella sp.]|nr:VOC family protein [Reyranella sp.]